MFLNLKTPPNTAQNEFIKYSYISIDNFLINFVTVNVLEGYIDFLESLLICKIFIMNLGLDIKNEGIVYKHRF